MTLRTNLRMRDGIVATVQLAALAFLIFAVGHYGLTSLSVPELLGVILLGELIDRLSRVITIFSNRREDAWSDCHSGKHDPREHPAFNEQEVMHWPKDYPAKH